MLGLSPTVWLIVAGPLVVWVFFEYESRLKAQGGDALVKPSMFDNRQMTGGLLMFFVLYLVQAGLFFAIPLSLSVSLGLTVLETGVRISPLSITLLSAGRGHPRSSLTPRRAAWCGSGSSPCSWGSSSC